ncbi:MAG: hypothetical protein M3Q49_10285 [Actinomycetota bacterium]|jgi:hypothetical protein|nr:hypothetical protein [Actinomycetota bacterium]MDP9486154.1 hypothetical protein [Actinomycetota bacterium]PLS85661.1 MAG: hypothetical protein CYG60_11400 [Actinomycetota bacterium]
MPLRTRLSEGATMPVFGTPGAALRWMDAHGLGRDEYALEGFYSLEDVERFVFHHGSGYERMTVDPAPDPDAPPKRLHPFGRLLQVARYQAR